MTRPQGRPRALSDEHVEELRNWWSAVDNPTQREMAAHYQVHPQTIYNVIHGKGPYALPNPETKYLEARIRHHRALYYNGVPEITDSEFDGLEDHLKELAPDSPVLTEVGANPPIEAKND